jgi:hypothetical protein
MTDYVQIRPELIVISENFGPRQGASMNCARVAAGCCRDLTRRAGRKQEKARRTDFTLRLFMIKNNKLYTITERSQGREEATLRNSDHAWSVYARKAVEQFREYNGLAA